MKECVAYTSKLIFICMYTAKKAETVAIDSW